MRTRLSIARMKLFIECEFNKQRFWEEKMKEKIAKNKKNSLMSIK